MGIIDYEKLEIPMKNVESMLKGYDMEEKQLIIRKVTERMARHQMNLRSQEIASNNMEAFGLSKLIKGLRNQDD